MGLINAILERQRPIDTVEIRNPFSYQEFAESKAIVLDVRCRDTLGRWLNVEMQISVYPGLLERLVYYACSMYVNQLQIGENYARLTPSISICLLEKPVFGGVDQAHHRFQMVDVRTGRELEKAIEVHTVELTKYNLPERSISFASKLEQWVFLLLHAQAYDAAQLKRKPWK